MTNASPFSSQSLTNKIKLLFFPIALLGYGIISTFVSEDESSPSRLITVPYRLVVLLYSIFLLILNINDKNERRNLPSNNLKLSPISLLFLFIILYSIRLIYDLGYNSYLVRDTNEYLFFWFGICLVPGISFLFLKSENAKKYLYLSWLFLAISSVLVLPLLSQNSLIQGRLSGAALNPISLGHQSASLILIAIYNLLQNKTNDAVNHKARNFINNKIVNALLIILGITLIIFSASRGPVIALIVVIILQLIKSIRWNLSYIYFFKVTSLSIFITAIVTFSSSFAIDSGSKFLDRFSSLLSGDEFNSNFVQRPELFSKAIELIAEYPIFGYGLEVPNIGYPHNLILEAFLATGILGGFLFLLIYIYAGIKAISMIMAKNNVWGWLGLLYIQYAIGAMFSGNLYGSSTFWYLLFAVLGLKNQKKV